MESIVNVIAGALAIYSISISSKPKDSDHPYGHGKAEFLSAAVEGTLIIVAGSFIIFSAVSNLLHKPQIQKLDYGILLVAGTAVVNFFVGTYAIAIGRKNNSLALLAHGKHLRTDTWSTLGIVAGLVLILITKIYWLDGAVAILFAIIIIYTGYKIIRTSIAGIMDEADIELLDRMVVILNENRRENWIDLHNLRIIKYGGTLHMDCHLTVPWYLNVKEAHTEIEDLSQLVRTHFGEAMELFVHSDACLEFSCRLCFKENCTVRQHPFQHRIKWTIENISRDSKHILGQTQE
ncbi:MAG: cation diffusion facilitator family transporter [Ginsengibacter sp.]